MADSENEVAKENIAKSIIDVIGNTPLVRLKKVVRGAVAEVIVKLESQNPGNSVKDRIAYQMIKEAELRGDIVPGITTVVEPTSGNTGIGLAMVCASLGYKLIVTMPDTMSIERRVVLKAYGAQVVLTPAAKGVKGAVEKAQEIMSTLEHSFMPQQFENPDNPQVHRETTGPEIWRDTGGRIDFLVSGVGTGGTLTGCAQYLRPLNPELKVIAVEPTESPVISGGNPGPHKIQGIGAGFVPKNLSTDEVDETITVSSEEAIRMARRLAMEEGIFCGISSGAAVTAAFQVASRAENSGKRVVCILPSYGERYLSTILFQDIWSEAVSMTAE